MGPIIELLGSLEGCMIPIVVRVVRVVPFFFGCGKEKYIRTVNSETCYMASDICVTSLWVGVS